MRISFILISSGAVALTALSGLVFAQTPMPPPMAARRPAVYDPQQFPSIQGVFDRFTLSARGDIDGFILRDGTEVKTAPDLSTQMAAAIKPGDRVTVRGLKAAALPLVSAVSITDEITHRTVSDTGAPAPMNPPVPPAPPAPAAAQPASLAPPSHPGAPHSSSASSETSGRVRMVLHGPQGEVNGVLLESGAILRFPPAQGSEVTALIQPRRPVVAEGASFTNAFGTVVDVRQIGPARDQLVTVGSLPRPMDDRGPAGPLRRPPPPNAPMAPPPAPPST